MDSNSVSREVFDQKLKEEYSGKKSNRSVWDRQRLDYVKSILKQGKASATNKFYHLSKSYELYEIGEHECEVIQRRTAENNKTIYILAYEDFYPKLLEAHLQTGHGGRDKMLYYIKNKWRIPRSACEIFVDCCETCTLKKTQIRKSVVVQRPIVSREFNARGQVDLIDFESCPDGKYNWLLNYQDHATKFLHLRPLQSNHPANVAEELSKLFFTFGAPCILQSNNGREFVAKIIEELVKIWPHCKIVHGRPRHPQSQGMSVERANADVENILRAWMIDKKSSNWSQGCYEVQWEKNTSRNRTNNRTPYEAVLGPIRCGVAFLSLPDDVVHNLQTEEDLEQALSESNKTIEALRNEQNLHCEQLSQGGSDVDNESDNATFTVCPESLVSCVIENSSVCTTCN